MNKNILIRNINLVDVIGEKIIPNTDILVVEGKITKIERNILAKDAKIYDFKGKYICPGLINMHAHLFGSGKPSKSLTGGKKQARILKLIQTKFGDKILNKLVKKSLLMELYSGTTTLRSVGDFYYSDVKQRDAINSGKYLGPTLYCSGFAITAPTGHGEGTFAKVGVTKEDYEKIIDENINHGVDWIKICTTGGVMDAKNVGDCGSQKMSFEQTKWCIEYAHKKGYRVASHTEGSEGMVEGIVNELDTIEHGALIKDDELSNKYKEELAKGFGKTVLITTISPAIPFAKLDPSITICNEIQKANAEIVCKGIIEEAKYALAHNVEVGLGTDASCPFAFQYGMWREVCYFHKYVGVSKIFALKTATITNAKILEKDKEIGSLNINKYFDAIILKNNPFDDLRTLSNPLYVFKRGVLITKKNHKNKKFEAILDTLI